MFLLWSDLHLLLHLQQQHLQQQQQQQQKQAPLAAAFAAACFGVVGCCGQSRCHQWSAG
jgi:hypothetical protein